MGLKVLFEHFLYSSPYSDKIRPKWDWKISALQIYPPQTLHDKIRPKWDWKEGVSSSWTVVDMLIKSDQNGIESGWESRSQESGERGIKSDQNGIERAAFTVKEADALFDKIRPKWDWKDEFNVWIRGNLRQIKSDQNGIESFNDLEALKGALQDKIRPKWDWKNTLDRTLSGEHRDKIRPKWDWKPKLPKVPALPSLPDKIRPKWDWKKCGKAYKLK